MDHVRDLLLRERERDLDAREEAALQSHLEQCADCRAFHDALVRNDKLLAEPERAGVLPPLPLPTASEHKARSVPTMVAASLSLMVVGLVAGLLLGEWRAGLAGTPAPDASPAPSPTTTARPDLLAALPGRLLFTEGGRLRLLDGGHWTVIEPPGPLFGRPEPFLTLSEDGERISAFIVDTGRETSRVRLWSYQVATEEESLVDLPYAPSDFPSWSRDARLAAFREHFEADEVLVVGIDGRQHHIGLDGRRAGTVWLDDNSLLISLREPGDRWPPAHDEILVWRADGVESVARDIRMLGPGVTAARGPLVTVVARDGEEALLLVREGTIILRASDLDQLIDDPATVGRSIDLMWATWNLSGDTLLVQGVRGPRSGAGSYFIGVVEPNGTIRFVFTSPQECYARTTAWGSGDLLAIELACWLDGDTSRVVVLNPDGTLRSEHMIQLKAGIRRASLDGEWIAVGTANPAFVHLPSSERFDMEDSGQPRLQAWAR